jgi:hypothetical protein
MVPSHMKASIFMVAIPCNSKNEKCYSWTIGDTMEKLNQQNFYVFPLISINSIQTFISQWEDKRYFRISCQIYNEFSEFVKLFTTFENLVNFQK